MVYSKIDLNQGYYQIPLDKASIHLTSFVVTSGQFESVRFPFGLTNAPRSFQKTMSEIFIQMKFVKVFLDDLLIFSCSEEAHKQHVEKVLEKLALSGTTINLAKYSFFRKQVEYLRIIINKSGISPSLRGGLQLEKLKNPQTKNN